MLTVQPPAREKCPMNSGQSGSLQGVLARSGSASSLAEAAAQASKLDSIASFFANQRDQQVPSDAYQQEFLILGDCCQGLRI